MGVGTADIDYRHEVHSQITSIDQTMQDQIDCIGAVGVPGGNMVATLSLFPLADGKSDNVTTTGGRVKTNQPSSSGNCHQSLVPFQSFQPIDIDYRDVCIPFRHVARFSWIVSQSSKVSGAMV